MLSIQDCNGGSGKEKNLPHAGNLTLVIQPVASKYTELAKPASKSKYTEKYLCQGHFFFTSDTT
jgi:hypothetical protein